MKRANRSLELMAIATACLAAASLLLSACRIFFPAESGWEYVGERRFTEGGTGEAPFIWEDAQGRPCIVYSEMVNFTVSLHARVFSSGAWVPLGGASDLIDGNAVFAPGGPLLATLDASGNPAFLYAHAGDTQEIVAWSLSGGSWVRGASIPTSEFDPDTESYIQRTPGCIALAPSGDLVIGLLITESASGGESTRTLRFFVLGAGSLTPAPLPDYASDSTRAEYSLAYGPDGTAHLVAAESSGSSAYALSVLELSGGSWIALGSNALPSAYRGTLSFDGEGVPTLAFMENLVQDFSPRIFTLSEGSWIDAAPGLADIVSESSYYDAASLPGGAVALAFIDSTTMAGEVSVIRAMEGSWAYLGLPEFTNGHCAGSPALAAGPDGNLYLAHTEIKEDDKISVMERLEP